jgi:CheY-like chemotaxis protein
MARVLVVDDDPDILDLVAMRLRRAGHRVATASHGFAALDLIAEKGAPEVAVLDVTMPVMSGLELLSRLRDTPQTQDMPAVFLSARVLPADVQAGQALGATYLTKPFVSSALITAIDRVLAARETGGDW